MSGEKGSLRDLDFVQNGIEDIVGCGGSPVQLFGVDEGIEKVWFIPVKVERHVSFSSLGAGLGLGCGSGTWGATGWASAAHRNRPALHLRVGAAVAEPLRGVDLRLDGWGRGLRSGWGAAAVRNQSFDRHDHGKSLDLAGDGASGHFVAESGQFPEPGQDLVATEVQLAQPVRLPDPPAFSLTAARCSIM